MPYLLKSDSLKFPSPVKSDPSGLLAIGGDLSPERLISAYSNGIFPWYSKGEPILWWSPDPRFVLFPEQLKVSRSMKKILERQLFEIRFNTAFESVIQNCSEVERAGQDGTWITEEMVRAYCKLHKMGIAQSAEAYQNNELAGGMYGVRLGNCFFGESMFSKVSNASKAAFISFVRNFQAEGGVIIDCQVHTEHLESLGAQMIPRKEFLQIIAQHTQL